MFAGYPERLLGDEAQSAATHEEVKEEVKNEQVGTARAHFVGANSAVLYGPGGERLGHYRKTNLFETDKTWAKPG